MNRHFSEKVRTITNKHVERCPILLVTREMQITVTMRCHYVLIILTKTKNNDSTKCWWLCVETESSIVVDRNVKWHSLSGKQFGSFF